MISLLAALALAPEPFRFVQIPAMVDYNSGLQERALDEAQRLSAGITVSVGFTVLWSAAVTALVLLVVRALVGLRVSEEAERTGLDISTHGESAYEA